MQICTCMTSCWKFSLAAILPFAFEVGCKGFFGQVQMHVCVHLHTRACTRIHLGTGTGVGMYVHDVLLEVLAWRPFCLLPSNCLSISSIIFLFWISLEGGSNKILN